MTDKERDAMLERIDDKLKDIKEALERDFKALYGNGHPGLLVRMSQMETWQKGHSDVWKWMISTLIAVAAVAVAALK